MTDADIPDPPEGYSEPYEYQELGSASKLFFTKAGRTVVAITVLLVAIGLVAIPFSFEMLVEVLSRYSYGSRPLLVLLMAGGVVAVYTGTTIVHENIHRVVDRYFGYDVRIEYQYLTKLVS